MFLGGTALFKERKQKKIWMLFLFLCIRLSLNKGFELGNLLIPQAVNCLVKCFRIAELLPDSPSRAFARLFQSITALRDDPGCNDTTEKSPISCVEGASAAGALRVLSAFSFKNRSCGLQTPCVWWLFCPLPVLEGSFLRVGFLGLQLEQWLHPAWVQALHRDAWSYLWSKATTVRRWLWFDAGVFADFILLSTAVWDLASSWPNPTHCHHF